MKCPFITYLPAMFHCWRVIFRPIWWNNGAFSVTGLPPLQHELPGFRSRTQRQRGWFHQICSQDQGSEQPIHYRDIKGLNSTNAAVATNQWFLHLYIFWMHLWGKSDKSCRATRPSHAKSVRFGQEGHSHLWQLAPCPKHIWTPCALEVCHLLKKTPELRTLAQQENADTTYLRSEVLGRPYMALLTSWTARCNNAPCIYDNLLVLCDPFQYLSGVKGTLSKGFWHIFRTYKRLMYTCGGFWTHAGSPSVTMAFNILSHSPPPAQDLHQGTIDAITIEATTSSSHSPALHDIHTFILYIYIVHTYRKFIIDIDFCRHNIFTPYVSLCLW